MIKAAVKGDLDKAREIVSENRHYWQADPDSTMKLQSETLKRQKAVKPIRRGFLHDALTAMPKVFGRDEFREEDHPRGGAGSKNPGQFAKKVSASTAAKPGKTIAKSNHKTQKEILEYLSGKPTVNQKEVKKHIYGTQAYDDYKKERKRNGKTPPSYFMLEDEAKVEQEVQENIKNGAYEFSQKRSGQTVLKMRIASAKGTAYNRRGRKKRTSVVHISVSTKDGYHWFPVTEDDDDDN